MNHLNRLTETRLAWLAGFIDGEGSIGITKAIYKDSLSPSYTIRLTVVNTNYNIITFIKAFTGLGSVAKHNKRQKSGCKEAFRWIVSSRQAKTILERIIPYLGVKREQAELALELANRIKPKITRSLSKGQIQPLSKVEIQQREKLYQMMKVVNQRGSIASLANFQIEIATKEIKAQRMF